MDNTLRFSLEIKSSTVTVSGLLRQAILCALACLLVTEWAISILEILDGRMPWIRRLVAWWRDLRDPFQKAIRRQQKQSRKMARFLERNQQVQSDPAETEESE